MALLLDLTTAETPLLNAIDMRTEVQPTGAQLSFSVDASGHVAVAGAGVVRLGFQVAAAEGIHGSASPALGFSIAAAGQAGGTIGEGRARLGLFAKADGFNDWSVALIDKSAAVYIMRLGDSDPVEIPISSWQATAQLGDVSSYLRAVVPAYENWASEIVQRKDERMEIRLGLVFADGTVRSEPIIEGPFSMLTTQTGPARSTATLSGYAELKNNSTETTRHLEDIQSISDTNGKLRVRAGIDLFLRPGMNAVVKGQAFPVSYINYYANGKSRFCEAGE